MNIQIENTLKYGDVINLERSNGRNSEKYYPRKSYPSLKKSNVSFKNNESLYSAKVEWLNKPNSKFLNINQSFSNIKINEEIILKIPISIKNLEPIFNEAKYILNLKDNWDDNDRVGYSSESWKSGANFLINYYLWLNKIYEGNFYLPKIHHGPKGSIDIVWLENNFRLFINIDFLNNKGNYYSDNCEKQYSEGEFFLHNVKFELLPSPIIY